MICLRSVPTDAAVTPAVRALFQLTSAKTESSVPASTMAASTVPGACTRCLPFVGRGDMSAPFLGMPGAELTTHHSALSARGSDPTPPACYRWTHATGTLQHPEAVLDFLLVYIRKAQLRGGYRTSRYPLLKSPLPTIFYRLFVTYGAADDHFQGTMP